jgi:hypothetical protein
MAPTVLTAGTAPNQASTVEMVAPAVTQDWVVSAAREEGAAAAELRATVATVAPVVEAASAQTAQSGLHLEKAVQMARLASPAAQAAAVVRAEPSPAMVVLVVTAVRGEPVVPVALVPPVRLRFCRVVQAAWVAVVAGALPAV